MVYGKACVTDSSIYVSPVLVSIWENVGIISPVSGEILEHIWLRS